MQQERNRWKWYLLRVTALLQSAFAVLLFGLLLYSLADEPINWWSEDFWATVAVCIWGLLVLYSAYGQLKAVASLMRNDTGMDGLYPLRKMGWTLAAATVAFVIQLFISGASFYSYLQMEAITQRPIEAAFYRIFMVLLCCALLALTNYLLSIKAYFELRFAKMEAEELMLTQLNNPLEKPLY